MDPGDPLDCATRVFHDLWPILLTLTDNSANGTTITYGGKGAIGRKTFTCNSLSLRHDWRTDWQQDLFEIELAHHGAQRQEYRTNLNRFLNTGCAELGVSSVAELVAHFEMQTRVATAVQPLCQSSLLPTQFFMTPSREGNWEKAALVKCTASSTSVLAVSTRPRDIAGRIHTL